MRKRRFRNLPPPPQDWEEFGGQRIFAVGFTEGGAPFGPTQEDFDCGPEPAGPRVTWADAREVLRELLNATGTQPDRDAIGRLRFLGAGLSNVVYGGSIQFAAAQEAESVVVKLPSRDATPDRDGRVRSEAALLRYLCRQQLPFRVPRPFGEVQTPAGLGVVQQWVDGIEIDLRAHRFPGGRPWEIVARVAAAIHAVDPAPLREWVRGQATRRDHALEFGSVVKELHEPEARETDQWTREHLPPATPSCLLHGDLLGQNLRCSWEGERVAVIDWAESRLGDPAYDVAIVTRGKRKPFATSDGLRRFLDAYNRLAAFPLTEREVQLFEVMLVAHLYRVTTREYGTGSPHAEQQRRVWRSVLNRATRLERL